MCVVCVYGLNQTVRKLCKLQARALLERSEGGYKGDGAYEAISMGKGDASKHARASSDGKNGSGDIGAAADPDLLAPSGTDPACCGGA